MILNKRRIGGFNEVKEELETAYAEPKPQKNLAMHLGADFFCVGWRWIGRSGTGIEVTGMNLIVAVDRNWAIGNKGDLLIRIPNDHKFFRQETMGKVVVLGRKTLETFPQGLPLKGRTNIILSANRDFKARDATVVHNLEELLEELKKYRDEDIYVIGGGSIYRQMLPYCNVAHVTKIDHNYQADAWFPDLDKMPDWKITADSEEQTYFDVAYQFVKYERNENEKSS